MLTASLCWWSDKEDETSQTEKDIQIISLSPMMTGSVNDPHLTVSLSWNVEYENSSGFYEAVQFVLATLFSNIRA